jgi:hypothetical protein
MKRPLHHLVLPALLGLAAASCSQSPKEQVKSGEPARGALGAVANLQISALVEALDPDKRLITLKGPRGNVGVYRVGDQVRRLSEIRVGDRIHGQYRVAAVAELREPTAEEKREPIALVEGSDRASPGAPPAGGIGRAVRVVTTIEALDPSTRSLTVKGPLDGLVTVRVDDPAVFERLQVGQSIVVIFAETLVLSVEPGSR